MNGAGNRGKKIHMSMRNAQTVLAAYGYYRGAIDGKNGPMSLAAARAVFRKGVKPKTAGWSDDRLVVAAAQILVGVRVVDGYWGHNTEGAFEAWSAARTGKPAPARPAGTPTPSTPSNAAWPLERDLESFYGAPGDGNAQNTAGKVVFPFAFRLDWALDQSVRSFNCHAKAAPAFQAVFDEATRHYGETQYRALGLDRFAGCYNPRRKRGGSSWSTHAWGIAVDLYAGPNALRTKRPDALFSKPDYEPFWRIVEAQGLVSLGRQSDFDWMHFQAARTR